MSAIVTKKILARLRKEERLVWSLAEAIVGEMKHINVMDGDVLFFRVSDKVFNARLLDLLSDQFRQQGKRVVIIMAHDSVCTLEDAVSKISKEKMRELGWVRAKANN